MVTTMVAPRTAGAPNMAFPAADATRAPTMDLLAALLVGRPFNIACVAVAFAVAAFVVSRSRAGRGRRALAVAALAWACYAGWEWLVVTRTPEANIRVDLLLLWPLLGVVSLVALCRVLRDSGGRG
ncbi:MAG: hypothetical protein AB7Q81_12555 [Gammaproteobacteria bacterium]